MGALGYFSSVPGMAVPGMAQPGRAQQFSYPLYLYAGQVACFYLDYLDVVTSHVLSPAPGGYYTMAVASGRAAGLTVPPPGRPWIPGNAGAGGTFAPLALGLHGRPVTLHEARAALERQRNESGWHQRDSRLPSQPPSVLPPPAPPPVPQPAPVHYVRAALEESRVAHGHYAPGGCRRCMSGGRED